MEFSEFELKIKKLLKKSIQDYKKMVEMIPEDESVYGYFPVLDRTIGNIEHTVDVYVSAKLAKATGMDVNMNENDDGSIGYSFRHKKKKNGSSNMYG